MKYSQYLESGSSAFCENLRQKMKFWTHICNLQPCVAKLQFFAYSPRTFLTDWLCCWQYLLSFISNNRFRWQCIVSNSFLWAGETYVKFLLRNTENMPHCSGQLSEVCICECQLWKAGCICLTAIAITTQVDISTSSPARHSYVLNGRTK